MNRHSTGGTAVMEAGTLRAEAAAALDGSIESLAPLRRRMMADPPKTTGQERVLNYDIRINDPANFYMAYKDIFVRRYYHFESSSPTPYILDGGGNIGLSVLSFKRQYPHARIVAFEPDTAVLPILQENLIRNGLNDVQVVPGALTDSDGPVTFTGDGLYSGSLYATEEPTDTETNRYQVQAVRLRDFLEEPVDFLKLNIEGAEWDVLADCDERLKHVREMVIEYHHLPHLPRTLHRILDLLDRRGFDYLINDFDAETNPGSSPPFRLNRHRKYYLLIFARRRTL